MLIMRKWDIFRTWNIFQKLLNSFCYHNMRYQTDSMTQIREKWLRNLRSLDFGRILTSNYANYEKIRFFRTWVLLQMLLPILYLHNMRYRTDPMTQTRENGRKHWFLSNFDIIMLIMRERDFSRTCVFLQMLINTLYFHKKHILTNISWLDFAQKSKNLDFGLILRKLVD